MKKGPEPTVINWQNLHIGSFSRWIRTLIVTLITIILLAASVFGIVTSKYYQDEVSLKYDVTKCPGGDLITQSQALEDEAKPIERKVGLMNCFCYSQFLNIK